MHGERTLQPEPPDFTVKQMVIFVATLSILAGAAGWIIINNPIQPLAVIQLFNIWYLYFRKKATRQAIVIAMEPIGAVLGAFLASHTAYMYLTTDNIEPAPIAGGILLCILAITALWITVEQLPKRWATPIRHIYI